MSSEYDSPIRNPSPPPELQQNLELLEADSIGNTAFSKHWLFSTLMKLIEEVEKEEGNKEDLETAFAVDVDEELQNELCRLWDMSMNSDVSDFLQEYKAIDILVGVIGKSKAPRVTEICVGILGNMACNEQVCKSMSENKKLICLSLLLLENTDAPTLVETTRLLYSCLSSHASRQPWIQAIETSDTVHGHLQFILESSTNCDLLKNTAEFVDTFLDSDEKFCVKWATPDFIKALLEAMQQIGCSHSEALETFLHIFQTFSTTENGMEALVSCSFELQKPLMKYLSIICEDEIVGLDGREPCLASALSVLHVLFTSTKTVSDELTKDERMVRIFLKILEPLCPQLQDLTKDFEIQKRKNSSDVKNITENDKNENNKDTTAEDNSSVSSSDSNDNTMTALQRYEQLEKDELTLLLSFLQSFMFDFFFTFSEDSACDKKLDIVPLLTYMDSSSSRRRLNYFILTLRDIATEKFDPVQFLRLSAANHKMDRLTRIIGDVISGKIVERTNSNPEHESQG